jgi:hypothetical protein
MFLHGQMMKFRLVQKLRRHEILSLNSFLDGSGINYWGAKQNNTITQEGQELVQS